MGEVSVGGRKVRFEVYGAGNGPLIFYMHGTPGSRLGVRPDDATLTRLGVRVVAHDRPGYGGSDPQPGRTVADVAPDVAAIADALDVATFAVYGISGGGPHALACAALLPDRVTRVASMVGIAPYDAPDLDWTAGMTKSNVDEFNAAVAGDEAVTALLAPVETAIREDPSGLLDALEPELSEPDRELLREQWLRDMLTVSFAEAVRTGIRGWVDDDLAFVAPWGFDPSTILAPTLLWHGADDVLAPTHHTEWLDRAIPVASFVRPANTGHLGAFAAQGHVLSWILGDDAAPRRRS